jgi:glycosyltransferase involved in cell wall biosynthesis
MAVSPLTVCFITAFSRARLSEYAKALITELMKKPSIGRIYILADIAQNPPSFFCNEKVEIWRVWKPDDLISISKILIYILRLNPDIVHFNIHPKSFGNRRIPNFVGHLLPCLSHFLGKKTIATMHILGEKLRLSKEYHLSMGVLEKLGLFLATKFVLCASCVTVTVPSYVDFLKKRYKSKNVVYVPHGAWDSGEHVLNDPPKGQTILIFGYMSPYKGVTVLLEAFEKIVQALPNTKLIIAGTDNVNFRGYLAQLKNKIKIPNVKFTGYVDEKDVPSLFKEASIVVLPYLSCLGNSGVFNIACSYGKPIIASDLPEFRELISMGASAILVPPNDSAVLSKAIFSLLNNPKLMEKMGMENYSFARKETFGKVAETFEKIYWNLKSKSNPVTFDVE